MWSSRRPESLRAVTIVSSSDGWRSTMAAQRAPAKPAAPRTATLGTQLPPDLRQGGLDGAALLQHVLVGERALGRAELEPERERLVRLLDLFAAVHVEQLDAVHQRARGRDRPFHLGGGHILGHHDGYVLHDGGEG